MTRAEMINRKREIVDEMSRCIPGVDFQKWLQLNDELSRIEQDIYVLNILSKDDDLEAFYAGQRKARIA